MWNYNWCDIKRNGKEKNKFVSHNHHSTLDLPFLCLDNLLWCFLSDIYFDLGNIKSVINYTNDIKNFYQSEYALYVSVYVCLCVLISILSFLKGLSSAMADSEGWRERLMWIHISGTKWWWYWWWLRIYIRYKMQHVYWTKIMSLLTWSVKQLICNKSEIRNMWMIIHMRNTPFEYFFLKWCVLLHYVIIKIWKNRVSQWHVDCKCWQYCKNSFINL